MNVHQTIASYGSTTSRRPPALAFHLAAAFDFRRQLALHRTHAEYDRIDALKLSQCSVRSQVGEFRLTSHTEQSLLRAADALADCAMMKECR